MGNGQPEGDRLDADDRGLRGYQFTVLVRPVSECTADLLLGFEQDAIRASLVLRLEGRDSARSTAYDDRIVLRCRHSGRNASYA